MEIAKTYLKRLAYKCPWSKLEELCQAIIWPSFFCFGLASRLVHGSTQWSEIISEEVISFFWLWAKIRQFIDLLCCSVKCLARLVKTYVLSFYPTKSNSNSILILAYFLEFLNYNLDSNLNNCVFPDLKLHNLRTLNLVLKHYLKTMHNHGNTGCGFLILGIHNY